MKVVVVGSTPKSKPVVIEKGDYIISQDPKNKFHYILTPSKGNLTPQMWLRGLTFKAKTDDLDSLKFPDDIVEITSTSAPKFQNVEELVGSTDVDVVTPFFTQKTGEWVTTTKFDGTQIIRYVYDGNVFFRTRGSLTSKTDSFIEKFKSMIEDRRLFSPNFLPDYVLIFEMIAKDMRIQVEYDEDFIVGLFALKKTGSINPSEAFEILPPSETVKLFSSIKGVRTYTPTSLNISEIRDFIKKIRNKWNYEGEVLYRVEKGKVKEIVKLKTNYFFTSAKMTFRKFVMRIWENRPRDKKVKDIDWEEALHNTIKSGEFSEEELIIIKDKHYIDTFLDAVKGKSINSQRDFIQHTREARNEFLMSHPDYFWK